MVYQLPCTTATRHTEVADTVAVAACADAKEQELCGAVAAIAMHCGGSNGWSGARYCWDVFLVVIRGKRIKTTLPS